MADPSKDMGVMEELALTASRVLLKFGPDNPAAIEWHHAKDVLVRLACCLNSDVAETVLWRCTKFAEIFSQAKRPVNPGDTEKPTHYRKRRSKPQDTA